LIAGFVIRGCTDDGGGNGTELEVTRIVEAEVEITREVEVEVTRVVGEVEVTRLVEAEVEVTRLVEVEVTRVVGEAEVTRIVEEEVEVTRIVEAQVEVTRIVGEEVEVTRIVEVPPPPPPPGEGEACTRINLEVGRDRVRGTHGDGIYVIRELSGHEVVRWSARDGWLDSGWLRDLPISRYVVHVQAFFYPATGGGPLLLEIVNPAPNSNYGWLQNGVCHSIEVQFPLYS
jgi:hypothetical protein